MKLKRLSLGTLLLGLWFGFTLLACNLSSPPPPTIVPRPSATPLPTIGYATLSPEELPEAVTTPVAQTNANLLNLINRVDSNRLMAHVQTLQNLGTRHVNSPYTLPDAGIGAARNYIVGQFQQIEAASQGRFRIISHTFPVSWGGVNSTAENIVGYLGGRETGAGVLLIGAHYDSTSNSIEDGSAYAPGANDNASGVAAVLEVARVLAENPIPPRATILFAAFSAEEIGREGSKRFVEEYVRSYNLPLIGMLNLDVIGSSTGPTGQVNDRQIRLYSEGPNESPSRQFARALNFIGFNYMPDLELAMQDAVDRDGRYGDHMSFSEAGYPAARIIEPLEEANRHHTANDTMDDIQLPYFTRVTQLTLVVTYAMGEGIRAPRNVVLRDAGNGIRNLVWEPVPEAVSYVVALRYPGSLTFNQYFETTDTNVASEIFTASRLAGIAIAARDANGLLGPLSSEYFITN